MSATLYVWDILSTDVVRVNGVPLELTAGDVLTLERPVKDAKRAYVQQPRLSDDQRVAKAARKIVKLKAYTAREKVRIAALTGDALEAHREADRVKDRAAAARKRDRDAALTGAALAAHRIKTTERNRRREASRKARKAASD